MDALVQIIQLIGFIGSQFTNSLLLYLLFTKAKSFGKYKVLMKIFAFYSMAYSFIEVITLPKVLIHGPSMILYTDGIFKYKKWIGEPLTTLYCASFGLCIAQLTLHFVYRYIAVCKPDRLHFFDGYKIMITMIPCFGVFVFWYLAVFISMKMTEEKQLYYKDFLMKHYNKDSFSVSFIGVLYKSKDRFGNFHWNFDQLAGIIVCGIIMAVCFSTIIFCALKTFFRMQSASQHLSERTRELNRQLFFTLGLQTLLPFLTMYTPVGLLLILPIFELSVGTAINQVGGAVALYPALDPLIAIFMIREFRDTILGRKRSNQTGTFTTTTGHSTLPEKSKTTEAR